MRTTGHQDTKMVATGPCGSYPCTDALTPPRCWTRSKKPRRLTQAPSSELLDSTTNVKCNASVSLLTSLLAASKLFLTFFRAISFYFWILYVFIQEISSLNILKKNIILKMCFIWRVNLVFCHREFLTHCTSLFKNLKTMKSKFTLVQKVLFLKFELTQSKSSHGEMTLKN